MALEDYASVVGPEVIDHLRQLARPLKGMKVVHINSTKLGGGVAEILDTLIPLTNELQIDTTWEVVTGSADFYECTKSIHNGLQGSQAPISDRLWREYEKTNVDNAERLRGLLEPADIVFIHDPQPAALINHCPNRKGKWIWRCHIDLSHPSRPVWKYLRQHVARHDASIFSLAAFAPPLQHPMYLIPPSINPLNDKNRELTPEERNSVYGQFGIDPQRPLVSQISRFDRFKDPIGVIQAYKLAKKFTPGLQLALAGGGATDDPEGEIVLNEVRAAAEGDPDIHVILLPPDAHVSINAIQRASDIVLQKSTKEGFGLTVTEALWKGKPVIGGDTGGIRLQITNHHTGFLVSSPEGAALRIRYLLGDRQKRESIGEKGREYVRNNFLITRHLREYLTLIHGLINPERDRVEFN
ncbi:MAG: glycosyltransferase [Nitrospinota bacterium]|nr:glycosyltransferase [Nitrospinota bacterium]